MAARLVGADVDAFTEEVMGAFPEITQLTLNTYAGSHQVGAAELEDASEMEVMRVAARLRRDPRIIPASVVEYRAPSVPPEVLQNLTSMVGIAIAPAAEHEVLNQRYLDWGYRGGIADGDVVYVARLHGRPVGLVRRAVESGVLMLRGMYVAPEHRRHGVGAQLLRAFVADLPPTDCYCIPFAHLTGFYGQGGFTTIDDGDGRDFLRERLRRYRDEGHDVLLMCRPARGGPRPAIDQHADRGPARTTWKSGA